MGYTKRRDANVWSIYKGQEKIAEASTELLADVIMTFLLVGSVDREIPVYKLDRTYVLKKGVSDGCHGVISQEFSGRQTQTQEVP